MKITSYTLKATGVLITLMFFTMSIYAFIEREYLHLILSIGLCVIGVCIYLHKPWARATGIVFFTLNILLSICQPEFWSSLLLNGAFLALLLNPWASQLAPLRSKNKPRHPSAFNIPSQKGAWKYRFALAGLLFILLPIFYGLIFFLPHSVLDVLRLPNIASFYDINVTETEAYVISPADFYSVFWAITGIMLLLRPRSARPIALAMAFTAFQRPIELFLSIGYTLAHPILILLSTIAFTSLIGLLWRPFESPNKLSSFQVISIVLIALFLVSNPIFFVYHRIEAVNREGEPFWGPSLKDADLPVCIPEEFQSHELFGVRFSLPAEAMQIASVELDYSSCLLLSPNQGLVQLETPALHHQLFGEMYPLVTDPPSLEEKVLTSPAIFYYTMRCLDVPADEIYRFSTGEITGYILPSDESFSRIIIYDTSGATSAGLFLRPMLKPYLFTIAASMSFVTPASADWYFAAGNKYLSQGDNIRAQLAFANACWLEPNHPEYMYMLASTVCENTGTDGAKSGLSLLTSIHLLEQALAIEPEYTEAADLLAELEKLKDQQEHP